MRSRTRADFVPRRSLGTSDGVARGQLAPLPSLYGVHTAALTTWHRDNSGRQDAPELDILETLVHASSHGSWKSSPAACRNRRVDINRVALHALPSNETPWSGISWARRAFTFEGPHGARRPHAPAHVTGTGTNHPGQRIRLPSAAHRPARKLGLNSLAPEPCPSQSLRRGAWTRHPL